MTHTEPDWTRVHDSRRSGHTEASRRVEGRGRQEHGDLHSTSAADGTRAMSTPVSRRSTAVADSNQGSCDGAASSNARDRRSMSRRRRFTSRTCVTPRSPSPLVACATVTGLVLCGRPVSTYLRRPTQKPSFLKDEKISRRRDSRPQFFRSSNHNEGDHAG
jgi:hypothetical protein